MRPFTPPSLTVVEWARGRGFEAHSCRLSGVGGKVGEGEILAAYCTPLRAEAVNELNLGNSSDIPRGVPL